MLKTERPARVLAATVMGSRKHIEYTRQHSKNQQVLARDVTTC